MEGAFWILIVFSTRSARAQSDASQLSTSSSRSWLDSSWLYHLLVCWSNHSMKSKQIRTESYKCWTVILIRSAELSWLPFKYDIRADFNPFSYFFIPGTPSIKHYQRDMERSKPSIWLYNEEIYLIKRHILILFWPYTPTTWWIRLSLFLGP